MGARSSSNDADHLEPLLGAGILDLLRLAKLPDLKEFCPGARSVGLPSTSADLPRVPAVAQLALYLLLLTRGLQPKHTVIYPHRDRLRDLLRRVYRKALASWDAGELKNVEALQPGVRTLAKFARRRLPPFEGTGDGLDAFGVKSVRESLKLLTEKLAMTYARNIARRLSQDPASVPPEVLGASLVASATSPGVVERLGDGHTIAGLMKLGVRAGLVGAGSLGAGKKTSPALDDLRKFLKRAGRELEG